MRRRAAWVVALALFIPPTIFHLAYWTLTDASIDRAAWGIPATHEQFAWTIIAVAFAVFALFRWGRWVSQAVSDSLTAAHRSDWKTALRLKRCPRCEYDLSGVKSGQCPECGLEIHGLDQVRDDGEELGEIIDRLHTAAPGRRCVVCGSVLRPPIDGRCPSCRSAYNHDAGPGTGAARAKEAT